MVNLTKDSIARRAIILSLNLTAHTRMSVDQMESYRGYNSSESVWETCIEAPNSSMDLFSRTCESKDLISYMKANPYKR